MSAEQAMTPVVAQEVAAEEPVKVEEVAVEENKAEETPAVEQEKPKRRSFFACFTGCRRGETVETPAEEKTAETDKEATVEGETEKENVAVGVPPVEAVASVEAA